MGERFHSFLAGLFHLAPPRNVKNEWEEPFQGAPSVFVVNHAGANGPIFMGSKFDGRKNCYFWIISDMFSRKDIPDYVRADGWWKPGTRLEPLLSRVVPFAVSLVIPPVFNNVKAIPVYHDNRIINTFRQSVHVLKSGSNLVIFPEIPIGHSTYKDNISDGWLHLGELWGRLTGEKLRIYPVYIDTKRRNIRIARPSVYDPKRTFEDQQKEIIPYVESIIRGRV